MLPRRQSIFHVGEEGRGAGFVGAATAGTSVGRRVREHEGLVVGLKILVHHHHGRHAHTANVILKQMVKPYCHGAPRSCFLRACFLCRLELSPNKDVYMYRGDQGFCSEECRWQQILLDEAREGEAAAAVIKERQRRGLHQARHHTPHYHTVPIQGRPPRKTLAVA